MALIEYSLAKLMELLEEEELDKLFSSFHCPNNQDVEYFIKEKARVFEDVEKSRTTVILNDKMQMVGYFTIANSSFVISELSNKKRKEIRTRWNVGTKDYVPAVLIGQLGKNQNPEVDCSELKRGDLMRKALHSVAKINSFLGVRVVYLECVPDKQLTKYYESFGFTRNANQNGKNIEVPNDDLIVMYRSTSNLYTDGTLQD